MRTQGNCAVEHRWGKRIPADVDVQIFADPASAGRGRLRNISISGGLIETATRIAVLSRLQLTIPATSCRGPLTIHAVLVRNAVNGIGVEWFDGDADVVAALMHEISASFARTHLLGERRL